MPRRLIILTLTVIAWLGAVAMLMTAMTDRAEALRGIEDPLTASALPILVPRLGVNADLTVFEPVELDQQLTLMASADITWVRHYFYWDEIEPVSGQFSWETADRIISAVAQHPNIQLIAVLQNTPDWAINPEAQDPTGPPHNPDDFGRFAAAFSQRYADSITYYQIWDEPNLFTNWGRLPPRPVHYAALLEAAYIAIHAADPQATVISAALAPTIERGPDNLSDWLYLQDLYSLGAASFFDAVGAKPYGFNFSPFDRRVQADLLNFSRVIGLREIMLEFNDAHKPIWASNWGWNHLPDTWQGEPSIWGAVSQAQQIDYTLAALSRVEQEWPWMAGMTLHHWNPPYPSDHPQQGFTLIAPTGQTTPLFEALRQHTVQTNGATTGWHPAKSPHAAYSGVWTFTPTGADIGWLNDSRFSFQFIGRSIGLILRQDNYVAHLYARVDDIAANALPIDAAGNAHLALTSPTLQPTLSVVTIAQDLSDGNHTLHVIADKGFDRYALVGFAVGALNPAPLYDAQIVVALLTIAITSLAGLISAIGLPWRQWNSRLSFLWRRLQWPIQLAITAITSLAIMIGTLLTWGQELPAPLRREPVIPLIALFSLGVAYFNLALPITIAAISILFWCIYHHIILGLALTIVFAPFFLFPIELYRFAFPIAEITLLITTAAWILRALIGWGKNRQHPSPTRPTPHVTLIDILVIAYIALGTFALFWSTYQAPALTDYRTLFVEPVLFYAIYRTSARTTTDRSQLIIALLIAGALVSGISFIQYIRGESIITAEDASRRLAGVYGSPNNLALFLGRVIPIAFAAVLMAHARWTRALAFIALALMMLTALLTQSVGGLIIAIPAALAVVLLLAIGISKRSLIALTLIAVLVLTGFSIAATQSDRFARALDFTQGTNFYRIRVMQSAWQAITDHPLTGLGLDQFLYAFRDRYIYPDAWPEPNLSHPHNILLDFWLRLGLAGPLLLIAFITACLKHLRHAYAHHRSYSVWGWVIVGLAGTLTNTLAHGLLDNSIFVPDLAIVFFLCLAVLSTSRSIPSALSQSSSRI